MGEFNCLEEVEISFSNPEVDYARADFISARDNLLRSMCSVKALVLDPITVEILFKGGSPHAPFLNLWSLHVRIHESICNATGPALAALLNGASNLNTLDISSKSPKISNGIQSFGYAKGYWAKPGLLDFTSQLKEVTLELTNGSNGIALAWHILEHAQNLKKMIIICFPILPHHYNFLMKLEGTKIISNATITIQRN
nr:PREDICTED: uncharacterized protein LOC101297068 isoform X2 [Fragaria vesca subsp. vesca]